MINLSVYAFAVDQRAHVLKQSFVFENLGVVVVHKAALLEGLAALIDIVAVLTEYFAGAAYFGFDLFRNGTLAAARASADADYDHNDTPLIELLRQPWENEYRGIVKECVEEESPRSTSAELIISEKTALRHSFKEKREKTEGKNDRRIVE